MRSFEHVVNGKRYFLPGPSCRSCNKTVWHPCPCAGQSGRVNSIATVARHRPVYSPVRLRLAAAACWRGAVSVVRRSPATFLLLVAISVTSLVLDLAAGHEGPRLLHHFSSNLAHFEDGRFGTLVASAFWLEDATELLPWTLLFFLVAAPAEAWLGTGRWLIVFLAGHVGATLATLAGLWMAIELGIASKRLAHSVDVGVSYGFFAVAAVLTYHLPPRWRPWYIALLVTYPAWSAMTNHTFTDFGHLVALAIGFSLYPLARSRAVSQGTAAGVPGTPCDPPAQG